MTPQDKPKNRLPKILLLAGLVVLSLVVIGAVAFSMVSGRKSQMPLGEATGAQPPVAGDTIAQNEWIEWEQGNDPSTFQVAGYEIAMGAVQDEGMMLPTLTVTNASGQKVTVRGEAMGKLASARFAVVQMDAANEARQILFSSYSGGAHCCVIAQMIEPVGTGWRTISLGAWDGDQIALPRDADGDGRKEFVLADQNFLYSFSSYAESHPPIAVFAVIDGKLEDVSKEPKYRPLYIADLPGMRRSCEQGGNGPCAGYAATAARAGQLDAAWPIVLANVRPDDWSNPAPCRLRNTSDCDVNEQAPYPTYAEALQWFLGEEGYTPRVFERRDRSEGPSFSCAAARKTSERLICSNRALQEIDLEMALAYTRAHALMPNRQALREAQAQFLRERDSLSDPKLMFEAYNQRIQMLKKL